MHIILKNKNTLLFDEFKFKCCIGAKGITSRKLEGDKKTPKGTYTLGPLYFRNDRTQPITKLKQIRIYKNMGWCDDPKSKLYNKPVQIKQSIKCEKLYKKNSIYDLLIPINYNTFKPRKNKGSAIFLHLTNNYKKTLGCIALKKKDMLILLKLINRKTKIIIR